MNKSISFSINLCVDHSLTPFEDTSVKFDLALIIFLLNLTFFFESFENCTNVFHLHSIRNVEVNRDLARILFDVKSFTAHFISLSCDAIF